jgi:hypothetical protein
MRSLLPDVYHAFTGSHRVMVQVQRARGFPLVDRNPQVFMEIPTAEAGRLQKGGQRVYRSGSSRLGPLAGNRRRRDPDGNAIELFEPSR